jgi:UDP-N-acetylmuramate: L-alanyl-gamma-D-glutamyl-meso-diaminopimelate ligase
MRIYFMSIGGTGMGNAAILMRQMGHEVLGADQALYPPMSDALAAAGIEPLEGFDAARLASLAPDLVVVGNVNTRGNPEVEWLLENRKVRMTSLPALLHEFLLRERRNVVVCGTHGKTTTSTLCAHLLECAGREPGFFIGGVPTGRAGGVAGGVTGGPFVIEGDEYDSAFFDKRSKFIHYAPNILLLNNLEFDHADIFRDVADIQRTFQHVTRIVPGSGAVVANGDDPQLAPLLNIAWTSVWRVGVGEHNDLRIADFHENAGGSRFTLFWQDRVWADVEWSQWGVFNARNAAMAALGAALVAGHADDPTAFPLQSLSRFGGVRRRQEVLFDDGQLAVISDFGHHPTAIAGTLRSLRARFPGRRLAACFEARSNTACRRFHEDAFADALGTADRVHLGEVFRAERYADDDRINLHRMAARIGEGATAHGTNNALIEAVRGELGARSVPTVFCFFSNGSFDGAISEAVRAASEV